MNSTHKDAVETILAQLGGQSFLTGQRAEVRYWGASAEGVCEVTLKLPRYFAFRVVLAGDDTYALHYSRFNQSTYLMEPLATRSGVCAEELRGAFDSMTKGRN